MVLTGCALALAAISTQTLAGAKCPKAPKDQWLDVLEMQKKIVNEYHFAIKKFKIDGNCYEIYGWEMDSSKRKYKQIEVYFNPVNGEIVKKEIDD